MTDHTMPGHPVDMVQISGIAFVHPHLIDPLAIQGIVRRYRSEFLYYRVSLQKHELLRFTFLGPSRSIRAFGWDLREYLRLYSPRHVLYTLFLQTGHCDLMLCVNPDFHHASVMGNAISLSYNQVVSLDMDLGLAPRIQEKLDRLLDDQRTFSREAFNHVPVVISESRIPTVQEGLHILPRVVPEDRSGPRPPISWKP